MKLAGVNTFRGIRSFREEERALRGVGAALAPLHVVCDPPTGCLFQILQLYAITGSHRSRTVISSKF